MQRHRHDGWTPERQRAFIQVLSVTGQVSTACRAVGISRKSAYKLLERPEAESFARAWEAALTEGRRRMLD
jgi:molybdenum-dependent DNA-binding transcriptional regulator ModE